MHTPTIYTISTHIINACCGSRNGRAQVSPVGDREFLSRSSQGKPYNLSLLSLALSIRIGLGKDWLVQQQYTVTNWDIIS